MNAHDRYDPARRNGGTAYMATPDSTFNGKQIRAVYDAEKKEWMFSVVDVCGALSESGNPRRYWSDLKRQFISERSELYGKIVQLKVPSRTDGKTYKTDVLNAEGITVIAKRITRPHTEAAFTEWLSQFDGTERKYMLKHKDKDVLEVELDQHGAIFAIGKISNADHLPVGTAGKNGADIKILRDWWKGRSIPASREGLRDLLENLDMITSEQLLDKSFGAFPINTGYVRGTRT